ncbi:SWIM zinc finger family protein [Nocardia wallacei]|uniref:SWIM zinc finger family protein n=2 Tax=Nocardia wallacei TaxID=480035 RepID=UPI001656BCF1|nr:SWIM zinc finger family protein [Nocardia wallacei]
MRTTTQVGAQPARWTDEQVAALAPDAAALTAARTLRRKWRDTGWHGAALWGRCQGSGATPYRTIVDLSGPAYKCSCPSRKFPCKHALSLLLTWAEGAVDEAGEPADDAAEWIGARAAAAPAAAAKKTARAATVQQRRARVAAGLAELDIWLCDQIRTGLAQADRSFETFESVAARMVDAQAPGAASALRQLPRNVVLREDWPTVLLREYGRLHLLAAAHRRADELPPALAAATRAHLGYPMPAETVRGEPPIRDHWMVLARRLTEEERLYTRRVWLRGRHTARWALIVDHNYGSPTFPADMPTPGTLIDADLHFYPAAAPLRAVWGARYGTPTPFTTIPRSPADHPRNHGDNSRPLRRGDSGPADRVDSDSTPGARGDAGGRSGTDAARPGSIAAALEDHARALGADPWLRSWPVVLAEVVPVPGENGWWLAEVDGTALPMALLAEQPWRLLGLSGGHPVAVVGEWTADGLVPLSAFAAGDITDVGGEAVGSAVRAPTGELTSAALLGTARRALAPARLPAAIAGAAARLSGDPAAVLLETAVLQDLFERGGVVPGTAELPDPAADDDRPTLPPPAATRLARMVTERSPFLGEWFEAAAPRDYRAPDALCALLLEQARTQTALREPLLRLAGVRGSWLARHNPQWRKLASPGLESADVWTHGRPAERRAWLAAVRATDPEAARRTLAEGWPTEPAPARAELLGVLADGLHLADEPLLESALDDARAEVRRLAADLLAHLPDSAFARRMQRRAARWLTLEQDRLVARLPRVLDDADRRDGIADRPGTTAYRVDGAPDVAAEWLRRTVAATPLRHWETLFAAPDRAVAVRMAEEMLGPMFTGWAEAALAQRDIRWAATLFEILTATPTLGADLDLRRELFALLPLDERVRYLRQLDSSWLAEVELLLRAVPRPWPMRLAEHLVRLLLERAHLAAARPGAPGLSPASYRSLFRTAAVHFPVEAGAIVTAAARRCGDALWERSFEQLANDLTERTTMLEELQ